MVIEHNFGREERPEEPELATPDELAAESKLDQPEVREKTSFGKYAETTHFGWAGDEYASTNDGISEVELVREKTAMPDAIQFPTNHIPRSAAQRNLETIEAAAREGKLDFSDPKVGYLVTEMLNVDRAAEQ